MDIRYSAAVIEPSTLTFAPEQSRPVYLSVTPDFSLESSLIPVYSGFLKATTDKNETHSIPYAGVAPNIDAKWSFHRWVLWIYTHPF